MLQTDFSKSNSTFWPRFNLVALPLVKQPHVGFMQAWKLKSPSLVLCLINKSASISLFFPFFMLMHERYAHMHQSLTFCKKSTYGNCRFAHDMRGRLWKQEKREERFSEKHHKYIIWNEHQRAEQNVFIFLFLGLSWFRENCRKFGLIKSEKKKKKKISVIISEFQWKLKKKDFNLVYFQREKNRHWC